ncbi:DUF5696 domain-containing protein [Paenibacillus sp. Marseille-Q4541]|uniref:DUF5696 domain-containing protein n=1 Tax=Paenibacillus sp. Marseille-Q4541 TaxID=2831522 RepID=UPI001BA46E45|nr:DUF5696 domain-containing protein [Paenibacillus sp. Marseille-Q4541]
MRLVRSKKIVMVAVICAISASTLGGFIYAQSGSTDKKQTEAQTPTETETQTAVEPVAQTVTKTDAQTAKAETPVKKSLGKLPDETQFQMIAENEKLMLKADKSSGHFNVISKTTGEVWRSFPNPKDWQDKKNTDAWKLHLASPFMFRYVEFNVRKDLLKESNLYAQNGVISQFEVTDKGFKVVYEMPDLGFIIPVEVKLGEDFVETKVLGDGLVDELVIPREESVNVDKDGKEVEKPKPKKDPMARLASIRLFPFMGAQTSQDEDGFLYVPDGPGALIDFKERRAGTQNLYTERIYGDDWAYSNRNTMSDRNPITMPVFGIKSNKQALLGVITEGEEYTNVVAAPSGSFSQFNWIAPEYQYRFKFFQPTDTKKQNGYLTYSKEITKSDRETRYYLIEEKDDEISYVTLAERFRELLMRESGMKPLEGEQAKLRLQLHLLGGDTEDGFLWDSYLPLTTTKEAEGIVQELSALGVDHMDITYLGWQNDGYSKFGGDFPVANKLGGNQGMKKFTDFAQSKGYTVYLDASSYTYNRGGKDGFRKNRDGLRDLASSVIESRSWDSRRKTFVSPQFMKGVVEGDLEEAKSLGINGYLFGDGIGSFLNTDFNENYLTTRQQSMEIQRELYEKTKETFGSVNGARGNAYTLPYINHMNNMASNFSYDLFIDRIVPFAQIALHGLTTYSFEYANLSDDYKKNFLKGIEYGAVPSFVVTNASSQELLKSLSLHQFYSTNYKDWLEEIVSQYQKFEEALSDVQNEFINGHREIVSGVFETTYSNGKQVIVNYNDNDVLVGNTTVKAQDYIVIKGGV